MRIPQVFLIVCLTASCGGGESREDTRESIDVSEGTPYKVASDPGGSYYLLELTGPPNARVLISKRVGKSGVVYTTTQVDCERVRDRELAAGETREEMDKNFDVNRKWSSDFIQGSIRDVKRVIACQNL